MEKTTSVDQKLARVERLVASRPALFVRQGAVVATWRRVGEQRLGSSYALRDREAGRQQSLYLVGSPYLAEKVRRLLSHLQRSHRQRLALQRSRAAVKASLRRHKHIWRHQRECVGLTLKGFEIREWRHVEHVHSTPAGA